MVMSNADPVHVATRHQPAELRPCGAAGVQSLICAVQLGLLSLLSWYKAGDNFNHYFSLIV